MEQLVRFSAKVDRIVIRMGKLAAWLIVPLIVVTIFDVVTRRFFVLGSTKLQELEWHFHTGLFALTLGFAYLKDAHVRVDLVREKLPTRAKVWIEFVGCLVFLLPYAALILYFGWSFVVHSYQQQEISAATTGLSYRWAIKSVILAGFVLVIMAGVSTLVRKAAFLFGPPHLKVEMGTIKPPAREDQSEGKG